MAVCFVQIMPQVTREQYDAVNRRLGMDSERAQPPQGALAHIAGPTGDGGWCIVSEWESRQDFERFFNEQLAPALRAEGFPTTEGPPGTWFEVYRAFGVGQEDNATRRAA